MKIERTRDLTLIASILGHPAIWPHIHEDGTKAPDPVDHDGLHWLLVSDDAPAGVFLLHARSAMCYEMHTCLLPRIWGAGANEAARLLLSHAFGPMGAAKLVTNVPASNRAALRFAKANGMREEGVNRESFLKDGVMQDQIMLGITIKEWKSCQQQFQS
jgi:RimJ/RimL family protein N-acetyltransferase